MMDSERSQMYMHISLAVLLLIPKSLTHFRYLKTCCCLFLTKKEQTRWRTGTKKRIFAGLRVERNVECPACHALSFRGEWQTPEELQSVTSRQCESCKEHISAVYLIQPKEKPEKYEIASGSAICIQDHEQDAHSDASIWPIHFVPAVFKNFSFHFPSFFCLSVVEVLRQRLKEPDERPEPPEPQDIAEMEPVQWMLMILSAPWQLSGGVRRTRPKGQAPLNLHLFRPVHIGRNARSKANQDTKIPLWQQFFLSTLQPQENVCIKTAPGSISLRHASSVDGALKLSWSASNLRVRLVAFWSSPLYQGGADRQEHAPSPLFRQN